MTQAASKNPAYTSWNGMRARCTNPNNPAWHRYGARGITVCDRWQDSFSNFLADMGERPGPGYSLDRIDNDGNYEPGNCRWATSKEQANNKSGSLQPIRLAFIYPSTRRRTAMEMHAEASAELRRLIPQAVAAGAPKSEVARWAGMTRKAVQDILRHGSSTQ